MQLLEFLPQTYVEAYVYTYAGYVKYNRTSNIYNGGCPFCHEGDSWGRKSRFYYIPDKGQIICHNCGYFSDPKTFIRNVAGLSNREILKEIREYDVIPTDLKKKLEDNSLQDLIGSISHTLPSNSINLKDKHQVKYYKDNPILRKTIKYLHNRRLVNAVNAPETFYLSLDDRVHANRLIIPYHDHRGQIIWYQTRKINGDDSEKYLSKSGSDRSLYGISNIDKNIPYIFMFEGAIDAMFVKNGSAVSGIQERSEVLYTGIQHEQIKAFPFHEVIWVLDSPYQDDTANLKVQILLKQNQKVFDWPEDIGRKYKDVNDWCVGEGLDEIPYKIFVDNIVKNNIHGIVKNRLMNVLF